MQSIIWKRYQEWLTLPVFDQDIKKELKAIKDNEPEIKDRFYKELEFGTAGLRGIMGAGTNRINKYTIGKATQGLAIYIHSQGEIALQKGVALAYDSRSLSQELAHEAALVLAANGIKTYIFSELKSTPELSFAVRFLNCIAGIVITASHNPAEYNGYKVYGDDGAQIATFRAEEIIKAIATVQNWADIPTMEQQRAEQQGLLVYLNHKIDQAFLQQVLKQSLRGHVIGDVAEDFKIVYTPLHGTGNIPVRRVLKEIGFLNVAVVTEQELPDANFATVKYPNPEDEAAFQLALELAKKIDAHLIMATDPDCDRVGVMVKNNQGQYVMLTGNQIGALLVNYLLEGLQATNQLPINGVIIKTIVTSEMGRKIAQHYGVDTLDVLTGFKYIGEKIEQFNETGEKTFLFGYEESYGYLAGTHVRDKDAVVASMLIAEMAAFYYAQGLNLVDILQKLYQEYGFYLEELKSIHLAGQDGSRKINKIMDYFRQSIPSSLMGRKVLYLEDYQLGQRIYFNQYQLMEAIDLPQTNALKLVLQDGAWICFRPSGTEPKLKVYLGVQESTLEEAQQSLSLGLTEVMDLINGV